MKRYQKFKIEVELEEDSEDYTCDELLIILDNAVGTERGRVNLVEETE